MGIYVYAVYQPTDPPFFLGAWEKYEEAKQAVLGDCSDGTEPSDKKYRLVQLYYTRSTTVTNGERNNG